MLYSLEKRFAIQPETIMVMHSAPIILTAPPLSFLLEEDVQMYTSFLDVMLQASLSRVDDRTTAIF